jgi:hypothetical protein
MFPQFALISLDAKRSLSRQNLVQFLASLLLPYFSTLFHERPIEKIWNNIFL